MKGFVGLTVVVVAGVLAGAFAVGGSGQRPAALLARYGPPGARFVVAFDAAPSIRFYQSEQSPNRFLGDMAPAFTLYVANLGGDEYEDVSLLQFPHALSRGNVDWYLHDYLFDYKVESWHGLPGALRDSPCREGDTPFLCPGRVADRVIVDGSRIFELNVDQLGEAEVERFFSSFALSPPRPATETAGRSG